MLLTAGIMLLVRDQHLVCCTPDTLEVLSTCRDTLQANVYGLAAAKLTGMGQAIVMCCRIPGGMQHAARARHWQHICFTTSQPADGFLHECCHCCSLEPGLVSAKL
jgi:hypothetical protein